jgi:hypothetical protein
VQPSTVRPHSSNMQWPWIELLLRSHDLPACLPVCNCPRLPAHLSPSFLTGGVLYSVCRMLNRSFGGSNLAICYSHVGRYQPFLLQISLDQEARPPTRNSSAAQQGRIRLCRCEAFLLLVLLYRHLHGLVNLHCCNL